MKAVKDLGINLWFLSNMYSYYGAIAFKNNITQTLPLSNILKYFLEEVKKMNAQKH